MAITVPIQGTPVSAAAFGIPVANEINRLTPLVDAGTAAAIRTGGTWRRAANQACTASVWNNITWDAEDSDTNGFLAIPNATATVPANCGGLYSMYAAAYTGLQGTIHMQVTGVTNVSVTGYADAVTGAASVSLTTPLAVGATVSVRAFAGTAWNLVGRFELWRVGN